MWKKKKSKLILPEEVQFIVLKPIILWVRNSCLPMLLKWPTFSLTLKFGKTEKCNEKLAAASPSLADCPWRCWGSPTPSSSGRAASAPCGLVWGVQQGGRWAFFLHAARDRCTDFRYGSRGAFILQLFSFRCFNIFFLYFFYKLSAVKIQFLIAFVEIILKGRGI